MKPFLLLQFCSWYRFSFELLSCDETLVMCVSSVLWNYNHRVECACLIAILLKKNYFKKLYFSYLFCVTVGVGV